MIGKIYISGLIGSFEDEQGVELIDVISQVRKQPEATSYEVYINSQGGVVSTGYDIYNFIKSLGLPITTIGGELVASIATVIFMAGQKRIVNTNTKFMIHLPMGGIEFATAEEMEDHSKHLKQIENESINFYSKELNLSKEAITPLLKNETWLTFQQLVDLGFVTTESEMKIAARAIITTKKNIKMAKKNRLQTILNAIFKEDLNKTIFSADNQEIVFPDLGEDDTIEVGARATFGGVAAEGDIVGADGKTYVFAAGILTAINEAAPAADPESEVTTDELIDALAATLEYTTELSGRVETIETEMLGLKRDKDDANAKLKVAEATIAKLKGSSKQPDAELKDKSEKKETTSSAVAQWRKNKQTKK